MACPHACACPPRAALNSTGKSIKAYSKRFAAGEAPEQSGDGARTSGGLDSSSVREDEIKELLVNLTALTKARPGRGGIHAPACARPRGRGFWA